MIDLIVAMLFTGVVLLFAILTVNNLYLARCSQYWTAIDAHLLDVGVELRSGHASGYVPVIRYEYWYLGVRYESERLFYSVFDGRMSERAARHEIEGLSPGRRLPVYIDPERPRRSVLRRGVHRRLWIDVAFVSALGLISTAALISVFGR